MDGWVDHLLEQGRFARSGDTRDAAHEANRKRDGDRLEVVLRSVADCEFFAGRFSRRAGFGDRFGSGKVLTGKGGGVREDFLVGSLSNNMATEVAGLRSKVEDVVG